MKQLLNHLVLATLSVLTTCRPVAAGPGVSWSTIDGGGGVSSGGGFAINGTSAQPDAGTLTGGSFSVEGGWWNPSTAGMEETPHLSIARSGPDLLLAWPGPATGFHLEWSVGLSTTSRWTSAGYPYVTGATHVSRSEPLAGGQRYYRLAR